MLLVIGWRLKRTFSNESERDVISHTFKQRVFSVSIQKFEEPLAYESTDNAAPKRKAAIVNGQKQIRWLADLCVLIGLTIGQDLRDHSQTDISENGKDS